MREGKAGELNGKGSVWPVKLLMLGGTILGMFWVPNESLKQFWIAGIVFGAMFIILQAFLLVLFFFR